VRKLLKLRDAALLLMVGLALTACAPLRYANEIKFCRSLIPYFHGVDARIDVQRVEVGDQFRGTAVSLAYQRRLGDGPASGHSLTCVVAPTAGALLTVVSLATEDGPLGPIRLHLLRRNWIAPGHVAVADPQPIHLLGPPFELPSWAAPWSQALLSGLPALSIYALLAAAYALLYGLVARINLALGELAMLAGFGTFLGVTAALVEGKLPIGLLLGLGAALWIAASYGYATARFVLAPLLERPGQQVLIATLGLAIAWSELLRLTQGAGSRWLAPLFAAPLGLARAGDSIVTATPMLLIAPLVAALALGLLRAGLHCTRFGRHWRAVADDPLAAQLLGVAAERVLLQTTLVTALLAGLGGALTTLHFGGVGTGAGLLLGLKALIAAVIGGLGSIRGAVIGAILVGLAETLWSIAVSVESRDLALFSALVLVLVLRPQGLFGAEATPGARQRPWLA
jgi:branched-chain amino acid transport system permease protein